jgi:multidrug efflux system outer membrane protein
MTQRLLPLVSALTAALWVGVGCSLTPPAPTPQITVPAAYKEAGKDGTPVPEGHWKPARPSEAAARGNWWTTFDDARLSALEEQAAAANPTLAAASARVKAARSALRASQADRIPQVNLSAGASRSRTAPAQAGLPQDTPVAPGTLLDAGLGVRYEVDLFRRVEASISAAQADANATEANYRSVLLALQADVAQTYFTLRTLDAEIAQLDSTVKLREENVRLIGKRFQAGAVAELDVARSRTELSTVQAEAVALRGRRARVEHALALLLGQPPAGFDFAVSPMADGAVVPAIPPGLPSALLERRPDVSVAQYAMQAATARVGVARSAIFPALALTANGGFASAELDDLFKMSSRSWLIGMVMSLPVIDGGRNKAAITRAEAQLEEAVAVYRESVLNAFADVENQLSDLRTVRDQVAHVDAAVASARRAADLADKRYRAGEDSYLQLLDAQRDLLAIERQAVQLRGTWAVETVDLIRSLGGGWQ